MGEYYISSILDEAARSELLNMLPPEFDQVVAHHVTFQYGVAPNHPLPTFQHAFIVGEIIDKGIQVFVVEVDDSTRRSDGKIFHITWSMETGRFPEESNRLVARGWWPMESIPLKLQSPVIDLSAKIK